MGEGGVYIKLSGDYTARIKPLRRDWLAEFSASVFKRRRDLPGVGSPCRSGPCPGAGPGACACPVRRGPSVQAVGAVRLRRAAGLVLRLAPHPARSISAAGPPAVPVPGPARSGPPGLAPCWRGPGAGPARSSGAGPASGPAFAFSKATAIFQPPTPGRKFPANFPARYFTRPV